MKHITKLRILLYKNLEKKISFIEILEQTVSNSIEYVDKTIEMASNIGSLWKNGDYNIRKKVQKLAYPNSIFYAKEIGEYRTDGKNKVFELFNKISSTYRSIKKSDKPFLSSLSDVVEHTGLEPVTFRLPV